MWDPDYMSFIRDHLQEQGFELPDQFDEEVMEGEEEDSGDSDDEDLNSRTALATTSAREILDVDSQASEDTGVVVVEGGRSNISQGRDKSDAQGSGAGTCKEDVEGENEDELIRDEIDGLCCPICFEAWSSDGDHHVCCLPCGHIYGSSCIKKWLRRRGSGKCPQCKKKCGVKDIRLLYATQIVAVDEKLQKRVRSLETKCALLEKKSSVLSKKEMEWKNREAEYNKQVQDLKKRTHDLENLLEDMKHRVSESSPSCSNYPRLSTSGFDARSCLYQQECSNKFIMKKIFQIDGARLFDVDSSSQFFLIGRRLPGLGGMHVLTKMSLLSNHETEDIQLPVNTKAVKDLQVSPHDRLVLLASLGNKLSVLSTESNNTILTYNLPAAPWSCSWDVCSSHYLYAGLQNGTVLQFDMRNTMTHVQSLVGLTHNPIHTMQSLPSDPSLSSNVRNVLTASSQGLCQWSFGGTEERPYLIPESEKEGVCISLAYCRSSGDIVASYRPKIEVASGYIISQPTPAAPGRGALGSHVHYRKEGCTYQKLGTTYANVSDIRLPKSAIIPGVYQNPVFASGDELTSEIVLQDLPSLMAVEHLKPKKSPLRDVKFTRLVDMGLLSCLSGDSLHLFTANLL